MSKRALLVCIVSIICLFILLGCPKKVRNTPTGATRTQPTASPTPVNRPPNVQSVTLDESRITLSCPVGEEGREGTSCSDDMTVSVTTVAGDPEGDVLTYNYTVSGGRVTGQGANVKWDLNGVRPGTYTITAGVDDGYGVNGQTKTETITVASCECMPAPLRGTVSGRVKKSGSSAFLAGAKVTLIREDGVETSMNTDANGRFNFSRVKANFDYTLKITLNGYADYVSDAFRLEPDANLPNSIIELRSQ